MIRLSPAAINEVNRLRRKHLGSSVGVLRISIQAKGCAGLAYQLDFVASAQADDQMFEYDAIQIAVPQQSLPYVDGLLLDYSEDLMGGSFRFHNPNATQTCSCGHSFASEATV
jgi:iron-sulfur cluster assembly accessory protein